MTTSKKEPVIYYVDFIIKEIYVWIETIKSSSFQHPWIRWCLGDEYLCLDLNRWRISLSIVIHVEIWSQIFSFFCDLIMIYFESLFNTWSVLVVWCSYDFRSWCPHRGHATQTGSSNTRYQLFCPSDDSFTFDFIYWKNPFLCVFMDSSLLSRRHRVFDDAFRIQETIFERTSCRCLSIAIDGCSRLRILQITPVVQNFYISFTIGSYGVLRYTLWDMPFFSFLIFSIFNKFYISFHIICSFFNGFNLWIFFEFFFYFSFFFHVFHFSLIFFIFDSSFLIIFTYFETGIFFHFFCRIVHLQDRLPLFGISAPPPFGPPPFGYSLVGLRHFGLSHFSHSFIFCAFFHFLLHVLQCSFISLNLFNCFHFCIHFCFFSQSASLSIFFFFCFFFLSFFPVFKCSFIFLHFSIFSVNFFFSSFFRICLPKSKPNPKRVSSLERRFATSPNLKLVWGFGWGSHSSKPKPPQPLNWCQRQHAKSRIDLDDTWCFRTGFRYRHREPTVKRKRQYQEWTQWWSWARSTSFLHILTFLKRGRALQMLTGPLQRTRDVSLTCYSVRTEVDDTFDGSLVALVWYDGMARRALDMGVTWTRT